jgi:hypothetical protein
MDIVWKQETSGDQVHDSMMSLSHSEVAVLVAYNHYLILRFPGLWETYRRR